MSKSLKILFISDDYPPISGGVATSTQRLARHFTLLGHKVLVVTFNQVGNRNDDTNVICEKTEGFEVCRISVLAASNHEFFTANNRRQIFDQLKILATKFGPDVLLSFYIINAGLLSAYLSHSIGVPHVVGLRGKDISTGIFSLPEIGAIALVLKDCAGIVCGSEYLRNCLLLAFPKMAERTQVIVNGVELPPDVVTARGRPYLCKKTGWPKKDPVAVFIGLAREKKGILVLCKAVEIARRQVPLRLLVIGAKPFDDDSVEFRDHWNRLTKEKALFLTGQLERSTALSIAREGDMIVMPSLDDGMANGLLEGMAMGMCPIVSDLFEGVVATDHSGWVVPRYDHIKLAEALLAAVRLPQKRKLFSTNARAYVMKNHSPTNEATKYICFFNTILNSSRLKTGK